MLVGLADQPLRRSEYRGITLFELDLDGLLAVRPDIALVDELAHSNAPGSRHSKRWQDVLELLEAGIDVYTTVNVQHLESLNDQVRAITGVQVRETVPDWIPHEADDILLVDLPPHGCSSACVRARYMCPNRRGRPSTPFSPRPTSRPCVNWRCRPPPHESTPICIAATGYRGSVRRRYVAACWSASTLTSQPRGWCAMPLGWPSAATCRSVVHVTLGAAREETELGYLQAAQQLAERLGER